ncbi:MAG: prolipoprotein diacylglyceryl transferase family protein, partial [Actinomycetota bacterium]
MLSVIPSPSAGSLEIGPLKFNAYGLMIALAVIAAVWLSKKRFGERGLGKPEDAGSIAIIASDLTVTSSMFV